MSYKNIFDILNYGFCQIKYSNLEISGLKDIGIRNFEFVAKTQFLSLKKSGLLTKDETETLKN